MTTPTIPEAIRALRERLGDSRHEFAERLHVSHSTVVSWEVGRRTPTRAMRFLLDSIAREESNGN